MSADNSDVVEYTPTTVDELIAIIRKAEDDYQRMLPEAMARKAEIDIAIARLESLGGEARCAPDFKARITTDRVQRMWRAVAAFHYGQWPADDQRVWPYARHEDGTIHSYEYRPPRPAKTDA